MVSKSGLVLKTNRLYFSIMEFDIAESNKHFTIFDCIPKTSLKFFVILQFCDK